MNAGTINKSKLPSRTGCFESEATCFDAVKNRAYKEGEVLVIRYEGPKGGPGMREMLATTAALYGQGMGGKMALITDGRFSGAKPRSAGRSRWCRTVTSTSSTPRRARST